MTATDTTIDSTTEFRPHDPPYLSDEPGLDDVARMVVALAREVWVLRDRLTVAETLLDQAGVLKRTDIDVHVPDETLEHELTVESDALIERVLGAPFAEALPIDEVVERSLRWTEASRARHA